MKAVWRVLALTLTLTLLAAGCGSSPGQDSKGTQVESQGQTNQEDQVETQGQTDQEDQVETQGLTDQESQAETQEEAVAETEGQEGTETLEHFDVDDSERDGIIASDYCTVKKYKGLKIPEKSLMVTDGEIQNEVNKILKDVEDYTDEAVKQYTTFNSKKEFEASIRKDLKEGKYQSAIASKLAGKTEFKEDLPQVLYDYYKEMFIEYYSVMVQQYYKTSFVDYLKKNNMSLDDFYATVGIEDNVKQELIWRYIAEKEGISPEGDDFHAYVEQEAGENHMSAEEFLSVNGESNMKFYYIKDRAYRIVRDQVKGAE